MSARYPRFLRQQYAHQDEQNIERATRDTTRTDDHGQGSAGRLRGIPAIGPNCPGHIRNTDPEGQLLRNIR